MISPMIDGVKSLKCVGLLAFANASTLDSIILFQSVPGVHLVKQSLILNGDLCKSHPGHFASEQSFPQTLPNNLSLIASK